MALETVVDWQLVVFWGKKKAQWRQWVVKVIPLNEAGANKKVTNVICIQERLMWSESLEALEGKTRVSLQSERYLREQKQQPC